MPSFSSLSVFLLLSFNLLLFSSPSPAEAQHDGRPNTREALEIIIGGGGGGHYPAPSPDNQDCPPPPPAFENARLEKAFHVIQRLRSKITCGRMDVVNTWVGNDVCRYEGFRCDHLPIEKERTVSAVMFNGFKFSGPELFLEGFMEELDDITVFHANSNFFRGPIPRKIDRQRFFFELDLSNQKLPGQFPAEVLGASQLTFLDLRFNNFCGPIPEQLFKMNIISAIYMNNNGFSSNLPYNLGKTPARFLTFAHNQLTGCIPKTIGEAKNTMEEIVFFDNNLEGCLPYEVGLLENAVLFDAGKNRLTGPIPLSFACLAKAELIYLADNQFYGTVPEQICKLPNLANFTLSNNFFTKVGPICSKLIKKKVLDVSKNCIEGLPNQRSKKECEDFSCRPKYCGNDMSFKYVPCKNNYYLHPHVSKPTEQNENYVSPKKTYAAALTPEAL